MKQVDNFEERRKHLEKLSDQELEKKFWQLASEVVNPLIELAEKNTSPSIERSVLLRMGFSSIESKEIVDKIIEWGLMSKGAGNVIYRYSKRKKLDVREAGLALMDKNKDMVKALFEEETQNEIRSK